jgi:hypothetical protein
MIIITKDRATRSRLRRLLAAAAAAAAPAAGDGHPLEQRHPRARAAAGRVRGAARASSRTPAVAPPPAPRLARYRSHNYLYY